MKRETNLSTRTKKLVVTAMMTAIMELLVWTPLGMIIIPPVSATTSHIPVIIAAILEGPRAGAFVGLALGTTTILRAATSPNFLDILFMNPLVSVFPRILIGITAYYSYVICKKLIGGFMSKNEIPACFLAAAVGSMTNTVGCMGILYVIYAKQIFENMGVEPGGFVAGIIGVYGTVEMLVAAVIVAAVVPVVRGVFYK